ncbi:MAG: alanine--tRNA ligase [Patescibacteria group bacterium]|jgi:alanyl-tRNA synthetase
MRSNEIKKKYKELLVNKYGHREITNASLVPENDPSILFTTAGMHPLTVYLLGEPHAQGKRLVNVQRSFRTNDIESVGDTTHCTFFEMLGNWSLGDYFKEEAVTILHEFLFSSDCMGFDPSRLYVTVFEGDESVPYDERSAETWKAAFADSGVKATVWDKNTFMDPDVRIFPLPRKHNWWGPVGQTGPCGPDCEVFYWRGKGKPDFEEYVPWDDSTMFIELGNDVFMEYYKEADGTFSPLKQRNVDFGGGLERITLVSEFKEEDGSVSMDRSVYDTDLFEEGAKFLSSLIKSGINKSTGIKASRIILDHVRAVCFIISDGVTPSNKDQGYVLRRLIRRVMRYSKELGIEKDFITDLANVFVDKFQEEYPHLHANRATIKDVILAEEEKFKKTLDLGIKELYKIKAHQEKLTGGVAFYIYESYGFPIEMTLDEFNLSVEEQERVRAEFIKEVKDHQDISRQGAERKFTGGLADQSETTVKYHTTTHLLHWALRETLGEHVQQQGSNITGERLRFDFSHNEKLTEDQLRKVGALVNTKIEQKIPVGYVIMPKAEAEEINATHLFDEKYGDNVKVYYIGNSLETAFNKEFCGGPHVQNTSEIPQISIFKQEKIGDGKMRLYLKFSNA